MKVLNIVSSLEQSKGGALVAACDLSYYLQQQGDDVTILAPYSTRDNVSWIYDQYESVSFLLLRRDFPGRLDSVWRDFSLLRSRILVSDVIIIHGVWSQIFLLSMIICRFNRKNYFVFPHGSLDPYDLRKKSIPKFFLGHFFFPCILQACKGILCTSEMEAKALCYIGKTIPRLFSPLPVRFSSRRASSSPTRVARDTHDFSILFVGRFDPKKNIMLLLHAVKICRDQYQIFVYVDLAGLPESRSPQYFSDCFAYCLNNRLLSQVRFWGFADEDLKNFLYSSADAFYAVSENENYGITVIESLRYGVPPFLSKNVYLYPEVLKYQAGVLVSCDVHSIVSALRDMASDPLCLANNVARFNHDSVCLRPGYLAANFRSFLLQ